MPKHRGSKSAPVEVDAESVPEVPEPAAQCIVLCCDFTSKLRRRVECYLCHASDACLACYKAYVLQLEGAAQCMFCHRPWTREFLVDTFSSHWVCGPYREHMTEVLYREEVAMLPAAQPAAERERMLVKLDEEVVAQKTKLQKLTQKAIDRKLIPAVADVYVQRISSLMKVDVGLLNLEEELIRHPPEELVGYVFPKLIKRIVKAQGMYKTYKMKKDRLTASLANYRSGQPDKADRRQFMMPCPADGCRGFLSTAWKCGLCESYVCSRCHEITADREGTGHTCDQEKVDSATAIMRETHPCPKCGVRIYKTEGCDQMFCTMCFVAFGWRSGKVIEGVVHNPHYFDWMRQQNTGGHLQRNILDVPCGGAPTAYELQTKLMGKVSSVDAALILLRGYEHNQGVVIPRWQVTQMDNLDLRVRFLLGTISEDGFRKAVQQRNKRTAEKQEVGQVLQTYQTVMVDLFQQMMHPPPGPEPKKPKRPQTPGQQLDALLDDYHHPTQPKPDKSQRDPARGVWDKWIEGLFEQHAQLREFTNERLAKIAKTFNTTCLTIEHVIIERKKEPRATD